jgi:hypothetical protein
MDFQHALPVDRGLIEVVKKLGYSKEELWVRVIQEQ